jgi:hypothetical protein
MSNLCLLLTCLQIFTVALRKFLKGERDIGSLALLAQYEAAYRFTYQAAQGIANLVKVAGDRYITLRFLLLHSLFY